MWLIVAERIYCYTVYQPPSVEIKESAFALIDCKKASAHLRGRQHGVSSRSTQFNFTLSKITVPYNVNY